MTLLFIQTRNQQTFSVKDQIMNILGLQDRLSLSQLLKSAAME